MRILRQVVVSCSIQVTCNLKYAEERIFPCYYHRSAILVFVNFSRHKELLGYTQMLVSAAGVK
jgi:hypothetical protein